MCVYIGIGPFVKLGKLIISRRAILFSTLCISSSNIKTYMVARQQKNSLHAYECISRFWKGTLYRRSSGRPACDTSLGLSFIFLLRGGVLKPGPSWQVNECNLISYIITAHAAHCLIALGFLGLVSWKRLGPLCSCGRLCAGGLRMEGCAPGEPVPWFFCDASDSAASSC